MQNVSLKFLIFSLIFSVSYQGHSDCSPMTKIVTEAEETASKTGKGISNILTFNWSDIAFDEKLLQYVKVREVKDNGFFNPQIEVCDYEGNRCEKLYSGISCHQVYGTQASGGGVSAKVFIDWEGVEETKEIDGLKWEWAENVITTEEDRVKFAKVPKICVCSQKGACAGGIFFSGIKEACDTCAWGNNSQKQKIKCSPIPRAPNPPPFCKQLSRVLQQVKIIPIADTDNDYFLPKVAVKVGQEKKTLYVGENQRTTLNFSGITHYFTTRKKDGKICAAYHGSEEHNIQWSKLQFPERCFQAPHAPQPEIERVLDNDRLLIKIKMSREACIRQTEGARYNNNYCIFEINSNNTRRVGDLSLRVVKPVIKKQSNDPLPLMKQILSKQRKLRILKENRCVPSITQCNENGIPQPNIEYEKKDNARQGQVGRMLCISGWQPDPEEFFILTDANSSIIPLKSIGVRYIKYVAIYSQESNRLFYKELDQDALGVRLPQDKLDDVMFDMEGNIFFAQERANDGFCSVKSDSEAESRSKVTDMRCVVYKLVNSEQYIRKDNNEPFKFAEYMDQHPKSLIKVDKIKVDKSEVFYADKLCTFDLESLKREIAHKIVRDLRERKRVLSLEREIKSDIATASHNLSGYEYIEVEAWSRGKTGSLDNDRLGMPGGYIKMQFAIDPAYPLINTQVAEDLEEGEGTTIIKMCNSESECKPLVTVDSNRTVIHEPKPEEIVETPEINSDEENKSAYIENGEIKYETVSNCNLDFKSSKYGAGGCINKHDRSYSRGSRGYVIIRPILPEITERTVENFIDNVINNILDGTSNSIDISDDNAAIQVLGIQTVEQIIKDAIKEELSCQ